MSNKSSKTAHAIYRNKRRAKTAKRLRQLIEKSAQSIFIFRLDVTPESILGILEIREKAQHWMSTWFILDTDAVRPSDIYSDESACTWAGTVVSALLDHAARAGNLKTLAAIGSELNEKPKTHVGLLALLAMAGYGTITVDNNKTTDNCEVRLSDDGMWIVDEVYKSIGRHVPEGKVQHIVAGAMQ